HVAGFGDEPDAGAQLLPRIVELGSRQPGLRQPRRRLHLVTDVLEQQSAVLAVADRERDAGPRLPRGAHHLELVAEPLLLDELLAVLRHALDCPAVAAAAAIVAPVAVDDVVAERRRPLEPELLQLTLA